MKIAIFSDIHGNKEALTSILNDIKKESIDEIISLGDNIGIGPNPKECMDIIIDNNVKVVLGNHELYFLKGTDITNDIDKDEKKHHNWIKKQITEKQKEYIEKCSLILEREYNGKKILFEHFLIEDKSNNYPFYDLSIVKDKKIKEIVNELNYDKIFIGHEHKDFILNNKLYDVGSSGCRKDNKTRYTILDTNTFEIETRIIEYDRKCFKEDILKTDYPEKEKLADWFFGIEL